MAFSTTRGADEYVSRGPTSVADIATSRRLYDRSDKIVFKERQAAPLYNILYRKMQKIAVTDPEPKANEEQETPYFITPTASQDSAADKYYIEVSAANGKMINVDDKFMVSGIYFDGSSTYSTNVADSYPNETVMVTKVEVGKNIDGAADSAKCRLTVLRGNGTNADPGTKYITTSMKLTKLGNSLAENGGYPPPWAVDLGTQQNFIEEKLITWGQSWIQDKTKVLVPGDYKRRARRARKDLLSYMEHTAIFGRKGLLYNTDGQPKRMAGGMVEFVPKSDIDGNSHWIDFGGAFSLNTFNEKLMLPMRYGSREKWAFCSMNVLTYYTNSFTSGIRVDPDYSKAYGIDITRHKAPAGTVNLVYEPALDYAGGIWANSMLILDLDYIMAMHMDGLDIQVLKNLQDNGTRGMVDGIYATFSLWRTFPDAHAIIRNITAPA